MAIEQLTEEQVRTMTPEEKDRVASMGSTIQRRPLREATALPSSPRMPSSGKASASAARISAIVARC